jgi:hypothetical protein
VEARGGASALTGSVFVEAVFAGADEEEAAEYDCQLERARGLGIKVGPFPMQHRRGHEHGAHEEKTCGTEKESQDEKSAADALGERGHESEKGGHELDGGPELNSYGAQGLAQPVPGFRSTEELWDPVDEKHDSESDAKEEEATLAVFAEESQDHAGDATLRALRGESKQRLGR